MFLDDETGPYTLTARAKAGVLPDGRSKIGKTVRCFLNWLKKPYDQQWNTLQEARLAIDVPVIVFYWSTKMLNEQGAILNDFKWAHHCLERLVKDIATLANKEPPNVPDLKKYVQDTYGTSNTDRVGRKTGFLKSKGRPGPRLKPQKNEEG